MATPSLSAKLQLPQLIILALRDAGTPLGAAAISKALPQDASWALTADALSELTRAGTLRRMSLGGEYAYELSSTARKQVTRAERVPAQLRNALVSTAAKADAALDSYAQRLADPTLNALIDASRTMWRTCAVAGVEQ